MSIYVGGTGTANQLDDYEEGTWTPTVTQGSISHSGSKYTKIGRVVYLQSYIYDFTNNSSGDSVTIGGLPYNTSNGGQAGGAAMYAFINNANRFIIYVNTNHTLLFYGVYSGNYSNLAHSNLGSGANIHLFATYIT